MSRRVAPSSLLVALAAGLASWTYGRAQADPAAAAETLFLAFLVTAVLLPVAALARRPAVELGIPAVLATAVVWVVPAGPARGAALDLLLLFTLAAVTIARLEADGRRLALEVAVPVAVALQLLVRSDRLVGLELDLRAIVGLLALPVAAAAALAVLARRRAGGVLLAGAATFVLVPGFSVSVTLALLALAAADLLADDDLPGWLRWGGALLVGAVTVAWEPVLALPVAGCALLHAGRHSQKMRLGIAALLAAAAILLPAARSAEQCLHQLALVPLLLPAAVTLFWRRPSTLLAGGVAAAAALRVVPDPGALAAPLALLALALDRPGDERRDLQLAWSGLLAAGCTLLAAYPWERDLPLIDALALAGLAPGWPAALLVAAAFLLLGFGLAALRVRWPARVPAAAGAGLALVAAAIFAALPPTAVQPLAGEVALVDAGRPRLARDLPGRPPVAEVVLDSYLSDSAMLASGTPVADVRIFTADGRRLDWTLRAGVDSGEWAARRADVAALPGFAAPSPWLAWVAPGGQVLAQRYRARWRPETDREGPLVARRIELVRRADLPDAVSLAVFHLELRP